MPPPLQLIETGARGWLEVAIPGFDARVLIQVAEQEGRVSVLRMIIDGDALGARTLKHIPLSRIEAMLNRIGPVVAGEQTVQRFTDMPMQDWSAEFDAIDSALAQYMTNSDRLPREDHDPAREPLARPDGSDPDRFYAQVAAAYREFVAQSGAPAKYMAEEAGVPVASVHRWIHEARRRGFLPPARKGRAG